MKQKILIIEDEPDVVELIKYNLLEAGCVVEAAFTGADGLRMARTAVPNLILLDLMPPDIDGLQVCKLLRHDSKTSSLPLRHFHLFRWNFEVRIRFDTPP